MSDNLFDDLQSEAESAPKPTGGLEAIRAMGAEVAALTRDIEELEAQLKEKKVRRYKLTAEQMPAVMDDAKVPEIVVDGVKLKAETKYKANIAADDPPEKREAAFEWVTEAGGGDIINNTVTVAFPKELNDEAAELFEELKRRFDNQPAIEVVRERKVPWNRLTSWLKEYVETPPRPGHPKLAIPLELLNATIGRIVTIKPVKD